MEDLYLYMSITVNVNDLNTPIKRQIDKDKKNATIHSIQEVHYTDNETSGLKVKDKNRVEK